MKQHISSKLFLYLVFTTMALPLITFALDTPWSEETYKQLMHLSGEWGARLLVFTLLITPVRMLFPKSRFWKWALKHRRQLGVAAFSFSAMHLMVYISYNNNLIKIMEDFANVNYLFAWGAMLIMIPLAITSTNGWIRKLGYQNWKNLQRSVYLVAPLAALHWILVGDGNTLGPALVHFIPLAILQAYRVIRHTAIAVPNTASNISGTNKI